MERLSLSVQTLYAELVDQLINFEAHRTIGAQPGTFVRKKVKGETYVYFQFSVPGGKTRQVYLGPESAPLIQLIERYREGRKAFRADEETIHRLCAQLRAGGATTTDSASARVIRALADSGVFRYGGVLVGTHAFNILGNALGIRWEGSAIRTHDVDIANASSLAIALPDTPANIPEALESLKMGFTPLPPLNPQSPSTSFLIRGSQLRVDVFTTAETPQSTAPVVVNRFKAAAQPLFPLDYLLEQPMQAAMIEGGVLVNVPDLARFALHKLIVAQERPAVEHNKRVKDICQASELFQLLAEERPGDLIIAIDEVIRRGKGWVKRIRASVSTPHFSAPAAQKMMDRIK